MEQKNLASVIMKGDHWIWIIYVSLLIFSAIEMFSASARLAYLPTAVTNDSPAFNHAKHLLEGLLLLLLCQSSSPTMIKLWTVLISVAGFALLSALPVMAYMGIGVDKGAVRSIYGVQPIEVAKVGLVMTLCLLMTLPDRLYHQIAWLRVHTQGRKYCVCIGLTGIICTLMATQNLSSALIAGMASMGVLFLGGARLRYLGQTALCLGLVGAVAMIALYALYQNDESRRARGLSLLELYFANRAHTWANRVYADETDTVPLWKQPLKGPNSQVIHAHMALANSYPIPQGPGNSRLRDFLPEAYSDYIFAIIVEEWSALGGGVIMLLYLVLLARCYILSQRTRSPYYRLLIVALPLIMVIQMLIHVGVCTDAMFVTGQPLPLISRGGSSIYMTSISFGIMLALSRIIKAEHTAALALHDATTGTDEAEQASE